METHIPNPLDYQLQSSEQTLAKGVEEYFSAYDEVLSTRELSPEATEFFRCHDSLHVVWGCDLTLEDEIVVKIASFLGTDGGRKVWRGYALSESREIYEKIGIFDIIRMVAKSLILVPRVMWRCMCMTKRWPWDNFDEYQNMPLATIRKQFGIRVAHHLILSEPID